jgi:hypothetical protein
MKSVVLLPYCPWPPDTGTRIEMMKHLEVLRELGECRLASARGWPVGFGWTDEAIAALEAKGYSLVFREDMYPRLSPLQWTGMAYGAVCRCLVPERAFGHANPYHRYAFQERWWQTVSAGYDLAVMHYAFWARFRTPCPQVVVLHEMLSNLHWGGYGIETRELAGTALVITVGRDEELLLRQRGVRNVLWSPPLAEAQQFPVTPEIAMVGTTAPQNIEGLKWIEAAPNPAAFRVNVYGSLAKAVKAPFLAPIGRYENRYEPYRCCGIHLLTRGDRPGLQIKAVEALACGRAIVARRGSMRGLPEGEGGWVQVETPEEMLIVAERLRNNTAEREGLAAAAATFYHKHLDGERVRAALRTAYETAAGRATSGARSARSMEGGEG